MGGEAADAIALQVDAPAAADTVVCFRKLQAADIAQVRGLHETWFPIRYNQSFYDGAATGVWMETGGPLFTQLAVQVAPLHAGGGGSEFILGAVTASTLPLAKIEDPELLAPDDDEHTHVMYILTLGCRGSVRRRGIASALLHECIDQAKRQPTCGAVYLHVKADNVSARRFYEKNGFENLRFLQDYYVIDGVRHDAYLYIRYVNGAGPQKSWLELLARPLRAFFTLASSGWRKLLDGLASDGADLREHSPSMLPVALVAVDVLTTPLAESLDKLLAMDFEDLLEEVEGVIGGAGSRKPSLSASATRTTSYGSESATAAKPRSFARNDIDDLLDLIGDGESSESAAVHPRGAATSHASHATSKDEFQIGGTKKCSQLVLNGEHAKRGVNTALSSQSVCSNLRCNECDFTVVQFLGKKWSATADYMFFRENVPNESKLRAKMDAAPGVAAYACQCKWLSIDVQTRVDSCRVKWACAGH